MERLSQEIIDLIAHQVRLLGKPNDRRSNLAPLSTISRGWQNAVERMLFRSLTFRYDDFDELARILHAGGGRRQYVRVFRYEYTGSSSPSDRELGRTPELRRFADAITFHRHMVKLLEFINIQCVSITMLCREQWLELYVDGCR